MSDSISRPSGSCFASRAPIQTVLLAALARCSRRSSVMLVRRASQLMRIFGGVTGLGMEKSVLLAAAQQSLGISGVRV